MDTAKLTIIGNNKGFAIVYIALAIFVLVGCLGLAIDLGHMYVVRGELQNAADASALAGAAALYTDTGGVLTPNPSGAQAPATAFISQNRSDGTPLTVGDITVEPGYWDIVNKIMIQNPPTPRPAVRVTVSRSAVPVFFAKVLPGIPSSAQVTSRQAVAIRGFPGSVPANAHVMPMALSGCMTEAYFSLIPFPSPPTTIRFRVGSNYAPGCSTGEWTSLTTNSNSARYMRNLVQRYTSGRGSTLHTGDTIYIKPGQAASVYGVVPSPLTLLCRSSVAPPIKSGTGANGRSRGLPGFISNRVTRSTRRSRAILPALRMRLSEAYRADRFPMPWRLPRWFSSGNRTFTVIQPCSSMAGDHIAAHTVTNDMEFYL